ncbi:glycosyltransferase family 1 protein [Runella slithyformis]|uniref:UDP-galactopyranose mutase n=1 Tax=Runella slithyformis (strain ATCC 29530 / DSM 19594 / LMG 11500 / NCIMB 11436 / LSU 4) TaxID=761193 RepID=A0A7U3ZKR4_RUNSL|nr:glycosyltransferase family 1 protein [Runella slithyformis]AEI48998.1 UDP-galactopyranose mutase [Runella slithyformis DSM 19594]
MLNDIVCFCHLRWNFVHQRPQHLMTRFAKKSRVFFVEEPVYYDGVDKLSIQHPQKNVWTVVPYLNESARGMEAEQRQIRLLANLFKSQQIYNYIFWYYTPLALSVSRGFKATLTVYDCMDELSAFKFAPVELKLKEKELIEKADVVFTGGKSIYQSKKNLHDYIFCFPSSIDKEHFMQARTLTEEPADQAGIPHPRIGFYGVVDERFDLDLLDKVSEIRRDWQFVIIGPVVKIDSHSLPQRENIHYLGAKTYQELPHYLSGWDIATCPFARNESTRYISPTKTPEYLAGGKPVISTAIKDVVDTYGKNSLVHIIDTPEEFIACAENELSHAEKSTWMKEVDYFLMEDSWDNTWESMLSLIKHKLRQKATFTKIEKTKSTQEIAA